MSLLSRLATPRECSHALEIMFRLMFGRRNEENSDSDDDEHEELLQYETDSSIEEDVEEEMEEETNTKPKDSKKTKRQYDKSLPAQHLYLGELDEEGVATVKEEESTLMLPLLYVPERVLFPGETLPMHIYNPHAINLLKGAFTKHQPVAMCTDLRGYRGHIDSAHRPKQSEISTVGTTADIVACKEDDESYYYHGPRFIVKLVGRQRFQVLEVYRKMDGMMDCQIHILPDVLVAPRPSLLLSSPPCISAGHISAILHSHQPEATLKVHKRALRSRTALWSARSRVSRCSVPGWVLRMYDFDYLREKVLEALHMQTITNEDKTFLPDNVVDLSYWLARRLPISDSVKLELLKTNCPTVRIMQGLRMLNEFIYLYCDHCETIIAKKESVFSMSVDGPLAAYVNPGGVVHDTLTLLDAKNLKKVGSGTTEDTWFPGYMWTVVYCKQCRDHKGWLFNAVKKDLNPQAFYGLRRPSLTLFKSNKDNTISASPQFRISIG